MVALGLLSFHALWAGTAGFLVVPRAPHCGGPSIRHRGAQPLMQMPGGNWWEPGGNHHPRSAAFRAEQRRMRAGGPPSASARPDIGPMAAPGARDHYPRSPPTMRPRPPPPTRQPPMDPTRPPTDPNADMEWSTSPFESYQPSYQPSYHPSADEGPAAWVMVFNVGEQDEGVYTQTQERGEVLLAFECTDDAHAFSELLHEKGFDRCTPLHWTGGRLSEFTDSTGLK